MNPVPRAVAATLRASRKLRDVERGVQGPDAGVVDREDNKVFGLDGLGVRVVGNCEGATLRVGLVSGVESGALRARARPVAAVSGVTSDRDKMMSRGTVGKIGMNIPLRGSIPRGRTLVAGKFGVHRSTRRQLEEIPTIRRIIHMAVLKHL